MLDQYYYPHTIRGIVVALSDLFNNLTVEKVDKFGNVINTMRVPITFGPRNKYNDIKKKEESGKQYYLQLPRVALLLTGISYASQRARGSHETRNFYDTNIGIDDIDEFITDIQPAPYDIEFSLDINTDSLDEYCQILENILPYFNPSMFLRVKEFSFLNIERNLKVIQNGVSTDFLVEQEENEKRYVKGPISLTVEAWLYRPLSSAKIIKQIDARYFVSSVDTSGSQQDIEVNAYCTSGAKDTSAFPPSTDFDTSGTFEGTETFSWFTSGVNYL